MEWASFWAGDDMKKHFNPETYILLGIPAVFFLGALFHFLYELSGNLPAVGMIAPVNESVFEHMKLASLPVALWWGIGALFLKKWLRPNAWFTAALLSMVTAIVTIPLLHYFHTGAFGIHSVAVDILNFLLSVTLGQLLGLHLYRHCRGMDWRLSLLLMLAILVLFAALTLSPPGLPLFRDPETGMYGMVPGQ